MAKEKKVFKSIAMAIGTMTVLIGICICACEQPTMAEQLRTWGIGVPVILGGAVAMWIGAKDIEFDA